MAGLAIKSFLSIWTMVLASVSQPPQRMAVAVPLAWSSQSGGLPRIEYLESISSQSALIRKRGLFARLVDLAAGSPEQRKNTLVRPFATAVDPESRILIVDPGVNAVHILDSARNSHKILSGAPHLRFQSPIGVDADAGGNLYVTDSALGRVFVFDRNGRFTRMIGEKKNEGIFKRPTGIAIDRSAKRIYLTDTLDHKVYVLTLDGAVEQVWGRRGEGIGEFNFPLAIALGENRVFVLDSMNFRVQVFALNGTYIHHFGRPANEPGGFFRPKALAIDGRRRLLLVVDSMFEVVQAFSYDGKLSWAFGHGGAGPGEFSLPSGISMHPDGRFFVSDSNNGRIQIFRMPEIAGIQSKGAP